MHLHFSFEVLLEYSQNAVVDCSKVENSYITIIIIIVIVSRLQFCEQSISKLSKTDEKEQLEKNNRLRIMVPPNTEVFLHSV